MRHRASSNGASPETQVLAEGPFGTSARLLAALSVAALSVASVGCGSGDAPASVEDPGTEATPDASAQPIETDAAVDGARGDGALAADPCRFDDLAARASTPIATSYDLAGYRLAVAASGGLRAASLAAPDLVVLETAPKPIEVAEADLAVEEHQGSFDVKETTKLACNDLRWTGAVADRDRVVLRGTFADANPGCATARVEARFCVPRAGHLGFEVASGDAKFGRVTLRLQSEAKEKIFGVGEQFPHDKLDLKGRALPVLAQEGGIGRGHTPITQAVNAASKGSGGSEDTTYYAAPLFLTNRSRGIVLENTEYALFDFRAADVSALVVHAPVVRGHALEGRTPLALIERLTEVTGRMPALPDWVHEGAVVALARPLDQAAPIVDALLKDGTRIAAVWNQTWSGTSTTFVGEQVMWNWTPSAAWPAFAEAMTKRGVKVLCYVNSMFRDPPKEFGPVARNLYQEAIAGGYLVTKATGEPYMLPITAFDVGLLDLTNPAARTWFKGVIKQELVDKGGCAGWMADFAEALPFDAKLASGVPASTYHNQYPVDWIQLNKEALEELGIRDRTLVWNRSGHTKTPGAAMLLWEGDQLTTWDKYDGLVSALHGLIAGGWSGISLNHSDVGGYTALSRFNLGYKRESEQLKRWTEMNAFTVVLRTHEGNLPKDNAQIYDDADARKHFARMSKVYRALAPYRKTIVAEAAAKGWPVVRHLAMHHPDDPRAWEIDDQFLLGDQILVAPIKNKCWTWPACPYDKEVWLPKGRWVHLWSGKVFGSATASSTISVKAPIGEPAVFYPEGSPVGAAFVAALKAEGIAVP